jgi:chromosome segregation ATPase
MDLLGKEGEEAKEGVRNVSQRLEQLESHVNALDSALQDFMDRSRQMLEQETDIEQRELDQIEEVARSSAKASQVDELKEQVEDLEHGQRKLERKTDKLFDDEILSALSHVTDTVDKINRASRDLRTDLAALEDRMDELENQTLLELNKREYDFQQKLDRSEFESEKVEMMDEIRKLRASVNVLADELDKKEDIEIE